MDGLDLSPPARSGAAPPVAGLEAELPTARSTSRPSRRTPRTTTPPRGWSRSRGRRDRPGRRRRWRRSPGSSPTRSPPRASSWPRRSSARPAPSPARRPRRRRGRRAPARRSRP
jgi:hypothetical protein